METIGRYEFKTPVNLKRNRIDIFSLPGDELRAFLDSSANFISKPPVIVGEDENYRYFTSDSYVLNGVEFLCPITGETRIKALKPDSLRQNGLALPKSGTILEFKRRKNVSEIDQQVAAD